MSKINKIFSKFSNLTLTINFNGTKITKKTIKTIQIIALNLLVLLELIYFDINYYKFVQIAIILL